MEEHQLGQGHDCEDLGQGFIVLEVQRYGEPPVKVEVPANATGRYAAELVSQRLGIHAGIWPGLRLVTDTGEKIDPEDTISQWNGHRVRLVITHTSMLGGK